MKKYESKIEIEVSVEEEQKPGLLYASVCKPSKYRCHSCDAPIRSLSVRRVVLCPVCKAENELK